MNGKIERVWRTLWPVLAFLLRTYGDKWYEYVNPTPFFFPLIDLGISTKQSILSITRGNSILLQKKPPSKLSTQHLRRKSLKSFRWINKNLFQRFGETLSGKKITKRTWKLEKRLETGTAKSNFFFTQSFRFSSFSSL